MLYYLLTATSEVEVVLFYGACAGKLCLSVVGQRLRDGWALMGALGRN